MIKVSVLYPNDEGKNFDIDYYCDRHMPLVRQLLGPLCTGIAVDQGIAGATPGSKAIYLAMGHLYFNSVADFVTAFPPNANEILGDIPNFTDTIPVVQISEVKM